MRVLLVEDDPGIASFICRGLAMEGWQVEWVTTAKDALRAMANPPNLAILDLGLPDMDGLSVCRAWRLTAATMPILVLSARDALESKIAGLDAGADDYLTKPFAFSELTARLRALERRQSLQYAPTRQLQAGELHLNLDTREVRLAGQLLAMTEREFLLLAYLLRHAGEVLSRQHLLTHAWDASADVTENAVDVYIGYLRRKLEPDGIPRMIHTVRGIGFKFLRES